MPSASDREEQLKVQLLQQEAALRALQAELDAIHRSGGSGQGGGSGTRRPHTAGSGRQAALHCAHGNPAAAPEEASLFSTFPTELVEPASSSAVPLAVEGHSAVAANGKVYVFGGTNNQHISNDVWVYNVAARRWKRCNTSLKSPSASTGASQGAAMGRYGHSAVLHNNSMIVFGGFGPGAAAGAARCGLLNSTLSLDLVTNEWSVLQEGAADVDAVKNHAAVVAKGHMYVFGGCLSDGRTNAMRCFDLERRRWLDAEPFNQQAIAAASGGGVTAIAKSDIPAPRSGHSANVFSRAGHSGIVVFGGRLSKHAFCNDAFQYDLDTRMWSRMYCGGQLPPPRCDHSAVVYRDHLVIFGGYALVTQEGFAAQSDAATPAAAAASGEPTKRYFSDCYVLHLVSCTWSRVELSGPTRPLGMCGHTAILYEDPEGRICMQLNGGWGAVRADAALLDEDAERTSRLVEGNVTHGTIGDTWVLKIANAVHDAKPAQAATLSQKQQQGRPSTARSTSTSHRDAARPSTARSSRNASRSPRLNADGTPARRPWSTQTCKATTAKEFGEPQFKPHPPCIRLQYQVDSIVRRLADEDVRRKNETLERLRAQFLKEQPPHKMNPDEQQESVDRLYYQQAEWRVEKQKQLESKWIPRKERTEVDDETLNDIVGRLATVPPKKEPTPPASVKRQGPRETAECVRRLYDEQRETMARRRDELERRYLWGGEPKRIDSGRLAQMVDRLAVSPPKKR